MSHSKTPKTEEEKPILVASVKKINKVFDDFNKAFDNSYAHWARRHSIKDDDLATMSFKQIIEKTIELGLPPDSPDYKHPEFMREYLGYGLIKSFAKNSDLKKQKEAHDKEGVPPLIHLKVGAALSHIHTLIRNGGKGDRQPFNSDGLTVEMLTPDAIKHIAESGKTPEEWIDQFKLLLNWLIASDAPKWRQLSDKGHLGKKGKEKQSLLPLETPNKKLQDLQHFKAVLDWVSWLRLLEKEKTYKENDKKESKKYTPPLEPEFCKGKSLDDIEYYVKRQSQDILDEVMAGFNVFAKVPIKEVDVKGKPLKIHLIENKSIPIKEIIEGEVESIVNEHNIPISAIIFGMRHAGMSVLDRPENFPMRSFLQRVIGVANEAGTKMELLNEVMPDLFKYDNKKMKGILEDQQYWIGTAALVERILGNNSTGYDNVLNLINANAVDMDLFSPNKAAVLLYALVERFEMIKQEILDKADGNGDKKAEAKLILQNLNTERNGVSFDKMLNMLKQLASKLSDAGVETERELTAAKRDDSLQKDPKKYYEGKTKTIFLEQIPRVAKVFTDEPAFHNTLEAFKSYAEFFKARKIINDEVKNIFDTVVYFCLDYSDPAHVLSKPINAAPPRRS